MQKKNLRKLPYTKNIIFVINKLKKKLLLVSNKKEHFSQNVFLFYLFFILVFKYFVCIVFLFYFF